MTKLFKNYSTKIAILFLLVIFFLYVVASFLSKNNLWPVILGQLSTIATIITAWIAIYLYKKGKKDEVENAARELILEIRESEKVIKKLLEFKNANPDPDSTGYPKELVKIAPLKSWKKYSRLFINRINNDEYDQLGDFYSKCEILEDYLEKNYNFFWVTTEERAKQKEIIGAKLALEGHLPELEFSKKLEDVVDVYMRNTSAYLPAGIRKEVDRSLNSINLITPTPVWNTLKTIASYNDLLG